MSRTRIGITLGDPGGIGPEVVAKSLRDLSQLPDAEFVVFGDPIIFRSEPAFQGLNLDRLALSFRDNRVVRDDRVVRESGSPRFTFHRNRPVRSMRPGTRGMPDKDNGAASFRYFEDAVAAARAKEIGAIVTAPISKKSWELAGIPWRGHTEYLASLYPGAIMTFWSEPLTVALFSHHLPLREALAGVAKANLAKFFRTLKDGMEAISAIPREYLVAGLNPHAGEDGLLGREELDEIAPAVCEARESGIPISGPFSPDVVFRSALGRPDKVVVALYHDQGLIPFKLAAFETGVNATLGMPFLRTSPAHGTALDIVGKDLADPRSMIAALRMAGRLPFRPL